MSFTNVAARDILNAFFGRTSVLGAFTNAATELNLHLALSTTTPSEAGGNFTEPVGNGYTRIALASSSMDDATNADPSAIDNTAALTFPAATGAGWGTITHVGIYSSDTGGTNRLLYVLPLTTSRTVNSGETVSFSANQLIVTLG